MYFDGSGGSPAEHVTTPFRHLRAEASVAAGKRLLAQTNELPLSFEGFRDRLGLLVAIGVPCSMQLEQGRHCGSLARVEDLKELPMRGLEIVGDLFSVAVSQEDIGSVMLHAHGPDKPFISISLRNRSGEPLLTLFGAGKSSESALWDDILGNPCQTQDLPEVRLNKS